jgi:hypothetical protein
MVRVVGSIYVTVAELIVTVAPVYVPCGIEIIINGCMLPIRCIISIGMEEEITDTFPLLLCSDIDEMFIEKASIQSAGASPILT